MAPRSVEGIYRDGRVELLEATEGVAEGTRVSIKFPLTESSERKRCEAGDRLMARMRQGIDFGGLPYPTREEIYDEPIQGLERRCKG